MKAFWLSFSILTIFPIPTKLYDGVKNTSQSAIFFPFTGLIIGASIASVGYFLHPYLPAWPLAVFCTLLLAVISGAFHLDGLADCADGFFSSRPKERIIEIMKDSQIGVMGGLALIFTLLFKVTLLHELCANRNLFTISLFAAALLGRCSINYFMFFSKPISKDGLGASFWNKSKLSFLSAIICPATLLYFIHYRQVLLIILCTVIMNILFAKYCYRKINGGSGDTLGASCELAETLTLLLLVISLQ